MWSRIWFCQFLLTILSTEPAVCNTIANNFNANLRDYAIKEIDINSTGIKTLQKEEFGRYANFAPVQDPIVFKEIPDNALSSSNYGRGLLHHDHGGGYGLHDYPDPPHHGYGYEYHIHEPDHHGGYGLHGGHPGGHHVGYGHHHHKHFDHGLATKALLWPIAGLALLGAAAALVSNPVLLQLGVVSAGRRKRRDTEEVTSPDFDLTSLEQWSKKEDEKIPHAVPSKFGLAFYKKAKKRVLKDAKQKVLHLKAYPTVHSTIEPVTLDAPQRHNGDLDEDKFIPIPLTVKTN